MLRNLSDVCIAGDTRAHDLADGLREVGKAQHAVPIVLIELKRLFQLLLVEGHRTVPTGATQKPLLCVVPGDLKRGLHAKLRRDRTMVRGMILVGDGIIGAETGHLGDVDELEPLALVEEGVDAHVSCSGDACGARGHVDAIEGEGMHKGVSTEQGDSAGNASQLPEGGGVEVAGEQHRRVGNAILFGELRQRTHHLADLPRPEPIHLGLFRVPRQVRAHKNHTVASNSHAQQGHERDAVFESPFPHGVVLVGILDIVLGHELECISSPGDATAIKACRPRPLLPHRVVAHGCKAGFEELLVVVAFYKGEEVRVHVPNHLQQLILAILPAEDFPIHPLYFVLLLLREHATHICRPAWICRLAVGQALAVELENSFSSLFRHMHAVEKPGLRVVAHVASKNVVLAHRELCGLALQVLLESLHLPVLLLHALRQRLQLALELL
mmetsp:Transcript_79549/g.170527  ORF Transcript_79549/g.170527 Transcript_79549/m.170527 type:complete len:441 (+) Transcript_79549:372-1694(+)